MPMDASRYPTNWRDISNAVKERAGFRCEYCGAPHGAWVYRRRDDPWVWHLVDRVDGSNSDVGYALVGDDPLMTRIVLTTHHIGAMHADGTPGDPHDKLDCRTENLVAACQRCHLLLDLNSHIANAAETRRRKRIAAGQTQMELGVAR